MSDKEISHEAKTALANAARRKAADRLERDGAHSMDAIRRRVRAIAQERNLQPADIAKLMHKRISTPHVVAFCEKHKISMDWLLRRPAGAAQDDQGGEGRIKSPKRSAKKSLDCFSHCPRGCKRSRSAACEN
jgi:hypothetical protein